MDRHLRGRLAAIAQRTRAVEGRERGRGSANRTITKLHDKTCLKLGIKHALPCPYITCREVRFLGCCAKT